MIPRLALNELISWIDEPETLVILGPRQVGKTTLMDQLQTWLVDEKGVKKKNLLSFNLDFKPDRKRLQTQADLAQEIQNASDRVFVFIDEVQRLDEPGLFLKGIIDVFPQVKLVVSGSSSLQIRSKVADVLTGRKQLINLSPLFINEVKSLKDDYLERLLVTGGYPAVFTSNNKDKQIARLGEIVSSYLEKDVEDYLGIELVEAYKKLLVMLADQLGQLVNISSLSRTLNLHFKTVERYLSGLQNTFLLDLVYPLATKSSIEIVKSPVPYFWDLGIRNWMLNDFRRLSDRDDRGLLFENLVYLEVKRLISKSWQIKFWRTKSKNEVDLVVTNRLLYLPIEVKFSELDKPEVSTSMKAFIENYEPEVMLVINRTLRAEKRWGSAVIKYRTIEDLGEEIERQVV